MAYQQTTQSTVPSTEYKHESACDLFEEDHHIAGEFATVLDRIDENRDDVEVGAAGCGSCFHTNKKGVFYVAQGSGTDQLALNYGRENPELAEYIVETAEDVNVPVSWNGDTANCVMLGVSDYYENYEPGTRVREANNTFGESRTGVVVDPEMIYEMDVPFRVWDQSDFDGMGAGGELLARFESRELAEEFAEDRENIRVDSQIFRGTSDGQNLVLWDGDDHPTIARTPELENDEA